jgi:capsular polysaccharide transport system ATP-binding protein
MKARSPARPASLSPWVIWGAYQPPFGRENARTIAHLYGLDADYVEAFARWLCDLGEYFERPVGVYSSGMRARLSFALLLALDFDIYLIDEGMPSTTDVAFNRRAGAMLRERLKGATVVVVSHQARTIEKFCKRRGGFAAWAALSVRQC